MLLGPGNVEAAFGLAIGLGWVPDDSAIEAGEPGDCADEFLDGDFITGAEVDRVRAVVVLDCLTVPSVPRAALGEHSDGTL